MSDETDSKEQLSQKEKGTSWEQLYEHEFLQQSPWNYEREQTHFDPSWDTDRRMDFVVNNDDGERQAVVEIKSGQLCSKHDLQQIKDQVDFASTQADQHTVHIIARDGFFSPKQWEEVSQFAEEREVTIRLHDLEKVQETVQEIRDQTAGREAREKVEREAQDKADHEAREKAKGETQEKVEHEALEKTEREVQEKAEREAQDKTAKQGEDLAIDLDPEQLAIETKSHDAGLHETNAAEVGIADGAALGEVAFGACVQCGFGRGCQHG